MNLLWPSAGLALSWWLATLGAVFVSGAFPAVARPQSLAGPTGLASVVALAVTAAGLAIVSFAGLAGAASWAHALVAAGLGAVLAPPCFAALPRVLVDRPAGALLLAASCAAATAAWLWCPLLAASNRSS